MAEYSKKWQNGFEKRYSKALKELMELEKEFKEMKDSNPDEWISVYPETSSIDFGENDGFYVDHYEENSKEDFPQEHIDISIKSALGMFGFYFTSFEDLVSFRNDLIKAIDKFKRPIEKKKVVIDPDDDCEDSEDAEIREWTIKAEQPLTQYWTYTVMAQSACAAVKMVEDDAWQDGVTHNDDTEYTDYGDIEYECI